MHPKDMEQAGAILPEGMTLHWFEKLESTNLYALSEPGLVRGTVIAADCQEAGRGRLGRVWHSPPGRNLYLSIVMYPQLGRALWGGFSLAAGLGLARAISSLGIKAALKWPNDLLVQGGKLAGILLEASDQRLVAGIGVNVNQEVFPSGLTATSLKLITGRDWCRDFLLAQIVREVDSACALWDSGQTGQVLAAWREYDIVLGRRITVLRGSDSCTGTAVDIGPGGELVVQGDDQSRHIFHSGEVTLAKSL